MTFLQENDTTVSGETLFTLFPLTEVAYCTSFTRKLVILS